MHNFTPRRPCAQSIVGVHFKAQRPTRNLRGNRLRLCLLLALCPALALADDWVNPGTGDWFLGSNWADGTVPAAVDDANVDLNGAAQIQLPGATANLLTIGASSRGALVLQRGGVLTSNFGVMGAEAGSTGTVTVDGTGSRFATVGGFDVGRSGNGTLTVVDGGIATGDGALIGSETGGQGLVTVDGAGSTITVNKHMTVGGSGIGFLYVRRGGVVQCASGSVGLLERFPEAWGAVTIDGRGSRWAINTSVQVDTGGIELSNGGELVIAGGSGTLQLGAVGVLQIDSSRAGFINAASVNGTGAARVVFAHSDPSYAFTRDRTAGGPPVLITGSTSVIKTGDGQRGVGGAGTTTLFGAHNYTGETWIFKGVLRINGSITSPTIIENSATLGGSGTVAGVSVAERGIIAPGSAIGTLTTGAMTLSNTSRLEFDLAAPGGGPGVSDLLQVNGNLTLDGVVDITALAGFAEGSYRLINFTGLLTDRSLTLGSLPIGYRGSIHTDAAGQVDLVVTSGRPEGNQAPTGTVSTNGTREGYIVTAANTLADADGLGEFSYQWLLDDKVIADASGVSLTLDDLAVGKRLRVVISYIDGQGFAEQVSSAAVGPIAPAGTDMPFQKRVFFANPADNPNQQTFIRLVNPNNAAVAVQIQGIDDAGAPAPGGEVLLVLAAQASQQLNALDLELGNPDKGIDGALGDGAGKWQLKLNSSAPIEVMSLIRTPDGFLTSVTESAPLEAPGVHQVYFANPGGNSNQQSFIRVVNRSPASGTVTVSAVDDTGIPAPGGDIYFALGPNAALNFNALDYTDGNPGKGLQGAFGVGSGKWQLTVASGLNLEVMSLIRTPDGFLTDLSNLVPRASADDDSERLLLRVNPASNAAQQGLIRLVNPGDLSEQLLLTGVDDSGAAAASAVSVQVAPHAALQLVSSDLEQGNPSKGLVGAFGVGQGGWQVNVLPQARIEAQSLLRVPGGFLTNLSAGASHDSLFEAWLWIFNPGSNDQQRSVLRIVNRSNAGGVVLIEAIDDAGQPAPGGSASINLAPRAAVELTAQELEQGSAAKGLLGALGDGSGKWRLRISADVEIYAQSLLDTPSGFLTDLSSTVQ